MSDKDDNNKNQEKEKKPLGELISKIKDILPIGSLFEKQSKKEEKQEEGEIDKSLALDDDSDDEQDENKEDKEKIKSKEDFFSDETAKKEDLKKLLTTVLITLFVSITAFLLVKQVRDTQEDVINARIWKITGIPRVVVPLPKIKTESLYEKSKKALEEEQEGQGKTTSQTEEKTKDAKEENKPKITGIEEEYSQDPFATNEKRNQNRLKESLKIQKNRATEKEVELDIPPSLPAYAPKKDPDPNAIMKVPSLSKIKPITKMPVPGIPPPDAQEELLEKSKKGLKIPKVSKSGLKPWMKYSKDFDFSPKIPRIGLIVRGLGMYDEITQGAIDKLPPDVALSFSPYAKDIKEWMVKARAKGHEVLIDLPLESEDFPKTDTGPLSLMTSLRKQENIERLETIMSKGGAFIGFCGDKGTAFINSKEHMDFLTKQIAKRGLIYINNVVGTNIYKAPEISLPTKTVDLEIKDNLFIESIKNRLERLETLAKYKGVAIAIIEAKPVSMQVINEWAETLINKYEQSSVPQTGAKQFIIAPISALVTE